MPPAPGTAAQQPCDGPRTAPGWGSAFSSLAAGDFRLLLTGLLVTATGGWVQRIAQDWLVLSLTGSPVAVGVTTMFQFLPTLLFGLHGGVVADRFAKRSVLLVTQVTMGSLAAVLATLTLTGRVEVWHVNLLAFVLGSASAVDNPTRQSFVAEMVPAAQLPSAVSLVSSTFQLGALVGPALSGVLIGAVGSGYAFALNGVSYVAAVVALSRIRHRPHRAAAGGAGGLRLALRSARDRPAVRWPIVLVGVLGLFTLSLPVTLATFAKSEFHSGATGYGLLTSALAVGSVAGALGSARSPASPRLRGLVAAAAALAAAELLTAAAPTEAVMLTLLVVLGASTLSFVTTAQSMVQLATSRELRGRVLGVYMLVFFGSGAVGGPLVGWIDAVHGPRAGLLAAGVASGAATVALAVHLARSGRLRVRIELPAPVAEVVTIVGRG